MKSYSDPLNQLYEDAAWFTRAKEIKLFVVRVSSDLRKALLKLLPGFEFHADNFSPWVLLEDAHTKDNDGWQIRSNRLVKDWSRRVDAFAQEKITLPEIDVVPGKYQKSQFKLTLSDIDNTIARSSALITFLDASKAYLSALRPPLDGIVQILAPAIVEDIIDLEEELEFLISAPDLKTVRFVLVLDAELPYPKRLLKTLEEQGLVCECIVDPAQHNKDLKAMLANENNDLETSGGVWPRGVKPPRRIDAPPEPPKEEKDAVLRKAGINPEFVDKSPKFRKVILGAAIAHKEGRMSDAILLQLKATLFCKRLEMHELRVICQITLANYLTGINQNSIAITELDEAAEIARQNNLEKVECQAHLALALLYNLEKNYSKSICHYARAAWSASIANINMLAIEAWRLAGQVAMQHAEEDNAILYFQEALDVAYDTDSLVLKHSSASEVARQLAKYYQIQGMNAQSLSLFEQADKMEAGEAVFETV